MLALHKISATQSLAQAEPRHGSWVPGADSSGFGIENLPYGVVRRGRIGRPAVRIGEFAVDLAALADAGLLDIPELPSAVFAHPTLNPFLELGREAWTATRTRLRELLRSENREIRDIPGLSERVLAPLGELEPILPVAIGDYVDFYCSIEHASNVGRIFRPESDPLTPNWRHLPIGYHGRAGTVVVTGTPVRRPCGQRPPQEPGGTPTFGLERRLDFELELGFVTGSGPPAGTPIPVGEAARYIFGFVLVNDWSAREIQRWEYQPLGPFLGKSFATSISAWIVPLEALEPLRLPGVNQDPAPLDHLRTGEPWALDTELEVAITPVGSGAETTISRTNARGLYWNAAQQLAHATSGGARVRAGDLFASGTISGANTRKLRQPARAQLERARSPEARGRPRADLPARWRHGRHAGQRRSSRSCGLARGGTRSDRAVGMTATRPCDWAPGVSSHCLPVIRSNPRSH
jgi:fumarylacetoacetase